MTRYIQNPRYGEDSKNVFTCINTVTGTKDPNAKIVGNVRIFNNPEKYEMTRYPIDLAEPGDFIQLYTNGNFQPGHAETVVADSMGTPYIDNFGNTITPKFIYTKSTDGGIQMHGTRHYLINPVYDNEDKPTTNNYFLKRTKDDEGPVYDGFNADLIRYNSYVEDDKDLYNTFLNNLKKSNFNLNDLRPSKQKSIRSHGKIAKEKFNKNL